MTTFKMLRIVASAMLAITVAASADNVDPIIEWVRSKGGYFSEKIEVRRMDPTDPNSYFGVFAREDVDKKERLMDVPKSCYLGIWDIKVNASKTKFNDNLCLNAQKLMNETKLGTKSEFAPYLTYLETQKPGQIPAMWSESGQKLLRKVAPEGKKGPLLDWMDKHKESGCIQSGNVFEEHAMEIIIQRGFDIFLIPVWDMVNHDNGRINTEHNPMNSEEGIKVWASKDILAGEEFFMSYDFCTDCSGTENKWGTPEILRDFGFVEPYPQRWTFHEPEIWFEIHEEDGELEADFDTWKPNKERVEFLEEMLERLENVADHVLTQKDQVPQHEWNVIWLFHQACVTAFSTALEDIEDDFPEVNTEL
jgi:hypothetical protein